MFRVQIWSRGRWRLPASRGSTPTAAITGSKTRCLEDHDWIPPLEQLNSVVFATTGRPWWHCFGHQIIAPSPWRKSRKIPRGVVCSGRDRIHHRRRNAGAERLAIRIRSPNCPKARRLSAQSDFLAPMPPCSIDDQIWTIQLHPEFTQDFITGLIRTRGQGVVRDHQLESARPSWAPPLTTRKSRPTLQDFLKKRVFMIVRLAWKSFPAARAYLAGVDGSTKSNVYP